MDEEILRLTVFPALKASFLMFSTMNSAIKDQTNSVKGQMVFTAPECTTPERTVSQAIFKKYIQANHFNYWEEKL